MARETNRFGRPDAMSERQKALAEVRRIARPVKLLALIERLESWPVDDNVITAVMEAVESGVDIDGVYEGTRAGVTDSTVEEEEEVLEVAESASAIGVYRLGVGPAIHFGKDGLPASPPVEYLFYSELDSENCFGCELMNDKMVADVPPYFRRGDILIFSTQEKPQSGDFVFVKVREGDDFTQAFFGRDETIRLRPLNPEHPEQVHKRAEIRQLYRLIARYQKFGGPGS